MSSTLSIDSLGIFLLAVFPGLVSLQVYRLLMPARPLEWKDALLQGLFYSIVNFAILFPLVLFVVSGRNIDEHPVRYYLCVVLLLLAAPAVWPFVLRAVFRAKGLRRWINLPYPTPWDFFFDDRTPSFLLIRLKNGKSLGGYWGPNSFAGSFPNDGDIYLEAAYSVRADGTFDSPIEGTRGALVRRDQYECIELFGLPEQHAEAVDVKK